MPDFDLICIGGGPGGQKAAIQAAELGKRVALIDDGPGPGGASVHLGTVPSKTLQEISRFLHRLKKESQQGLGVYAPRRFSLGQLLARSGVVIGIEEDLAEEQLLDLGVKVFQGHGSLAGPQSVEYRGRTTEVWQTQFVLLATGSRPRRPPDVPFLEGRIYDSNELLAIKRMPDRLCVVGAGIIGCEYASIFAGLGTEVHLFELADRILGQVDLTISQTLMDAMRLSGVQIHLNDSVASYTSKEDSIELTSTRGESLSVDQVLISKGRLGNVEGLNLSAAGLEASDRGVIAVDSRYQTAVPSIFAVGDVIGPPGLSSSSMVQGMYAARAMFKGEEPRFTRENMPVAIWTMPEVAMIGPTEEELKGQNIAYGLGTATFESNTRSLMTGETRGLIKLLFSLDNRRLLAVHICSDKATELLAFGQAVLALQGTIDFFIEQIFNYPTLSGVYRSAALDALRRHPLS